MYFTWGVQAKNNNMAWIGLNVLTPHQGVRAHKLVTLDFESLEFLKLIFELGLTAGIASFWPFWQMLNRPLFVSVYIFLSYVYNFVRISFTHLLLSHSMTYFPWKREVAYLKNWPMAHV